MDFISPNIKFVTNRAGEGQFDNSFVINTDSYMLDIAGGKGHGTVNSYFGAHSA